LVAQLDALNSSAFIRSYVWGSDLSGTLQGAGGVGGLLAVWDASTLNSQSSTHFASYDGNGNVTALINAADGIPSAQYEYGPFGEVLRKTGTMATANPFRYSTKYQDEETGLLYYGYRYYDAGTGRWGGRDPLGEKAGVNLYGFVANVPLHQVDVLGRLCIDPCSAAVALGLDKTPEGKPARGIVVCCEGKKYPCVWPNRQYPYRGKALEIVRNCMLAHEEEHFDDVPPCPLCSFIVTRPRYKIPVDPHGAECLAYQRQLKCLQETKDQCGGDPDCEVQVHVSIRLTEMSKDDECTKRNSSR
jgi:RHS repeat-associated protein